MSGSDDKIDPDVRDKSKGKKIRKNLRRRADSSDNDSEEEGNSFM